MSNFFETLFGFGKKYGKGGKPGETMVAEVQYRDGANYKNGYVMIIPPGLEIKVGDEITSDKFGIPEQEWYDKHLPGEYDKEFDHNILEIEEIRPMKEDDIISNKKA